MSLIARITWQYTKSTVLVTYGCDSIRSVTGRPACLTIPLDLIIPPLNRTSCSPANQEVAKLRPQAPVQTPAPHACVAMPLCPWSQTRPGLQGRSSPSALACSAGVHLVREQSAPWLRLLCWPAGGTHNSPQGPEGIPGAKLPVISIQDALQVNCK